MSEALTNTDLQGALPLIARGKVRDLYDVDEKTLLFVATDRISAYDVIMENVRLSSPCSFLSLYIFSLNFNCTTNIEMKRESPKKASS